MDDIEITYRNRILLLCLLILAIVGIFASVLAIIAFHSGIAVVFLVLCFLLGLIISGIYQSQEFQSILIEESKERGGYKIKGWKENWRLFFVILAVGVLCFLVLPLLEDYILGYNMMIDRGWIDPFLLLLVIIAWIYTQGYWVYKNYLSGKDMKAARLLCWAKYKNDGTFYYCMEKQIKCCKRITDFYQMDDSVIICYEPDWRTRARLQAYVDVNYERLCEKYAGQNLETDEEKASKELKILSKSEDKSEESIQIPSREEK